MMLGSGTLVGSRYTIIEKIGIGGMAIVYKAKDEKLDRFVTFKVLKEEFCSDPEFIKKFTVEATAAAKLNHPNIVRVYDFGNDGMVYYIVMEYIDGCTLKELINKNAPFSNEEAVAIASQIASGLEHAHNNNIIHRDIKPQNILVTKDGTIKVTDFGIARVSTSTTVTTDSVGSVHYFSPEQARGGFVDNKSDIYSLGIVLFEMVTGRLPFNGDSTVALAIKHITEPIPDVNAINPNVSKSIVQIILKATAKMSAQRYATIEEFNFDLKKSLNNSSGEFVKRTDSFQNTSPTIIITEDEINEIRNKAKFSADTISNLQHSNNFSYDDNKNSYDDNKNSYDSSKNSYDNNKNSYDSNKNSYDSSKNSYDNNKNSYDNNKNSYNDNKNSYDNNDDKNYIRNDYYYDENENNNNDYLRKDEINEYTNNEINDYQENKINNKNGYDEINDYDKKKEKKVIIAAVITAIVIISVTTIFGMYFVTKNTNTEFTVPNFVGKNWEQARQLASEFEIYIEREEEYNDEVEKDVIIFQDVSAGSPIKKGDKINVIVSLGTDKIIVPDVVNKEKFEAFDEFEGLELNVKSEEIFSEDVSVGVVIKQKPNGNTEVKKGSDVFLYISKGSEINTVTAPNVVGKTENQARQMLANAGFTAKVTKSESNNVEAGYVISQGVKAGSEYSKGYVALINVSTGKIRQNTTIEVTTKKQETNNNNEISTEKVTEKITEKVTEKNTESATEKNTVENNTQNNEETKKQETTTKVNDIKSDENETKKATLNVNPVIGNYGENILVKISKRTSPSSTEVVYYEEQKKDAFPLDITVEGSKPTEYEIYINNEYKGSKTINFE